MKAVGSLQNFVIKREKVFRERLHFEEDDEVDKESRLAA